MADIWKILGVECCDGDRCECCGAVCTKRRVVLEREGNIVRFGTQCAALRVLGDKKSGSVKSVMTSAKAASAARLWLKAGHSPEVVSKAIWNKYGFSTRPSGSGVDINGIGLIGVE